MKRKSLLIFLLTAVSATTVVAAAGCAKKHQHTYTWQSDAAMHRSECECGDKKDEGAHIDVLNNATSAEGADGKCDVCGRENYAVTFDVKGHGTAPEAQIVYSGGKAVKPSDLTDESGEYLFGGWFKDTECTVPFDFDATVSAAVTVYAKWEKDNRPVVTFNLKGHGKTPESQKLEVGGKATKPEDPVIDGWFFRGWHTDEECTTPFDFNTPVTSSITLYAKWEKDERRIVTFDTQGIGVAPERQKIEEGEKAVEPEPPAESGYTFGGWYSNSSCTYAFDFDKPVTGHVTVYAKWTVEVSFDMGGHGTAPDTQTVRVGTRAKAPTEPEAENFYFGGWYTDAELTQWFEFSETITKATTLYAKWVYAYTKLEIGAASGEAFGNEQELKYVFKAATAGRYKLSLGIGASAKCRFTTDLDGEGVYFGAGCDAEEKYFDMTAGQIIVVTLCRGADVSDTAKINITVEVSLDEPLPAGWEDGEYTNGVKSLMINSTERTIEWNGTVCPFTYIGGRKNEICFTYNKTAMTGKLTAPNTFEIAGVSYMKVVPQRPVTLEEMSGTYKPADAAVGGVNILYIYPNGNGLVNDTTKYVLNSGGSSFNAAKNMLMYGNPLTIYPILDDNDTVCGVRVIYGGGTAAEYTRTGEAPDEVPETLPLDLYVEYLGEIYSYKRTGTNFQSFNGSSATMTAYNKAENKYSLKIYVSRQGYKYFDLTLVGEGDNLSIEVRTNVVVDVIKVNGKDQEVIEYRLVDTLTKYVPEIHDFPADGAEQTIAAADFKKGYYYYRVPKTSGYLFSSNQKGLQIYYNLTESNLQNTANLVVFGETVQLTAGTIVGVAYPSSKPESVGFKVEEVIVYGTEENPYEVGTGGYIFNAVRNTKYYAEFTAPADGVYGFKITNITISEPTGNADIYTLISTVDGKNVGYVPASLKYELGEKTRLTLAEYIEGLPYKVELRAGDKIIITFNPQRNVSAVRLEIKDANAPEPAELTLVNGAGSITESGSYKYTKAFAEDVIGLTFEGGADFTVRCMGEAYTGKRLTLTAAQLSVGFDIELAEGGTVDYTLEYAEGTQNKPLEVGIGVTDVDYLDDKPVWIKVTAPADNDLLFTLDTVYASGLTFGFCYEYKGVKYGYTMSGTSCTPLSLTAIRLAAGESTVIKVYCSRDYSDYTSNPIIPVRVSIDNTPDFTENAETLNFVEGKTNNGVRPFDVSTVVSGSKNLHIADTDGNRLTIKAGKLFYIWLETGMIAAKRISSTEYRINWNAAKNFYFGIVSDEEQTISFHYEYRAGAANNPLKIVTVNGEYTSDLSSSDTYFVFEKAGTYMVTAGGMVMLNDSTLELNTVFTANAGDIIICSSLRDTTKFTVKLTVAEELIGKYNYTDGEAKLLDLTAFAVDFGDGAYTLVAIDGDVYTYEKSTGVTVELTLGETILFGDKALTKRVVFTEAQAGSYTGTATVDDAVCKLQLSLKTDGTVTFIADNQSFDAFAEATEGGFVFTCNNETITLTFDASGNAVLDSAVFGEGIVLEQFFVYRGVITTENADKLEMTIELNGSLTKGKFSYNNLSALGDSYGCEITVTENNGTYSYANDNNWITGTFTIEGNVLNLQANGYGSGPLNKA